jgi:hypothetical protein
MLIFKRRELSDSGKMQSLRRDPKLLSVNFWKSSPIWDRCKNLAEKWRFFAQTSSSFVMMITLVYEKNANFFRRKLAKIAKNCDDDIDPCSWLFSRKFGLFINKYLSNYALFIKSFQIIICNFEMCI